MKILTNDKAMQFIRTAVQSILSFLLLKLAAFPLLTEIGVAVSDQLEDFLVALLMAVYVATVRWASEQWSWLGYLNGPPVEPTYSNLDLPG